MAVLWRGMEHKGKVDTGYQDDTAVATGAFKDRNSFFEKHVRISTPIPSDTQMKVIVKQVWTDRQKGDGAKVGSSRGPRSKQDVYGKLKPSGCSMLFIPYNGFVETNAWIEEYVTRSGGATRVPILGGGVVMSWNVDTFQYESIDAGFMVLGIRVGKEAFVEFGSSEYAEDNDTGDNMQSKIVYHFEHAVRG